MGGGEGGEGGGGSACNDVWSHTINTVRPEVHDHRVKSSDRKCTVIQTMRYHWHAKSCLQTTCVKSSRHHCWSGSPQVCQVILSLLLTWHSERLPLNIYRTLHGLQDLCAFMRAGVWALMWCGVCDNGRPCSFKNDACDGVQVTSCIYQALPLFSIYCWKVGMNGHGDKDTLFCFLLHLGVRLHKL